MARIFIALVLAVMAWAADPTYSDVQPTIEQAIKLLEAKDADGVFTLCIEPKQLEKFKADPKFAEMKADFVNGKSDLLLSVLKLTAKATTTWDAAASSLTFAHPDMKRGISFLRVDNHWYIKD